eukprot:7507707-Karenia_brevis.AAC.1
MMMSGGWPPDTICAGGAKGMGNSYDREMYAGGAKGIAGAIVTKKCAGGAKGAVAAHSGQD